MENFVYYFLRFFSFSFIALCLAYLFNGEYEYAVLAILSFVAVKYLDSKKYYDKYWDKSIEKRQIISCLLLFALNMFFYYQFFITRPYVVKATLPQKKAYEQYETALIGNLSACQKAHNTLLLNVKKGASANYVAKNNVTQVCSSTMLKLNRMYIDQKVNMPDVVEVKMFEIKKSYIDTLTALLRFDYVYNDGNDKSVSTIVKYNQEQAFDKMNKTREMLKLPELPDKNKEFFETTQ